MTLAFKKLLLLDGIGALVTMICLLLINFVFKSYFGMPEDALLLLASIAFGFFLFSFSTFYFVKTRHSDVLNIISYANLFYCLLIMFLLINHREYLKAGDWIYFISEALIILALVFVERRSLAQTTT